MHMSCMRRHDMAVSINGGGVLFVGVLIIRAHYLEFISGPLIFADSRRFRNVLSQSLCSKRFIYKDGNLRCNVLNCWVVARELKIKPS